MYLEPCQIWKMELSVKRVKGWKSLIVFAKNLHHIFFMHCKENYLWRYRSRGSQMLFKIGAFEISPEYTCFGVLLKNVAGLKTCNIVIKRLQHTWFPVKFAKFLREPVFTDNLRLLFFKISNSSNLFKDFITIHPQQICDHLKLSQWQTNLKMH